MNTGHRHCRPGESLLVQSPSLSSDRTEICADLLSTADERPVDLLQVSYTTPPAELVQRWQARTGPADSRLCVLSAHDTAGTVANHALPDGAAVVGVSPEDLTALGIHVDRFLAREYEPAHDLSVCFDSITAMLQYVGGRGCHRFLNGLTTRLERHDAVSHFHLDPSAVPDRTVSRAKTLFDDQIVLAE